MIFQGSLKFSLGLLITASIFFIPACSSVQPPLPSSAQSAQTNGTSALPTETSSSFSPTSSVGSASSASSPHDPSVNIVASATLPVVVVTAVNGNLSIRAGPDFTFDAFASLPKGHSAQALARSVLDGWVEVELDSENTATGWIYIKSAYALVTGNVLDLPEIRRVEWPFGSYLRNCTSHQLIVQPGGQLLPPAAGSVQESVWFYPGVYAVYDLDMAGRPWIMDIKLTAHTSIDVHKDGTGRMGICR
jgi:hypothetical protein